MSFVLVSQKFFRFLGHHSEILQYLTEKLPEDDLQKWEGVVTGLQGEAARLQQQGLEKGIRMQEVIQVEKEGKE